MQHIARQGYHIVREPPDAQTRAAHPLIARLNWDSEAHYPAARTPSTSRWRAEPRASSRRWPIANYDNNQHAANENLRLQNLWDAIEIFAGLFVPHGAAEAE